MPGKGLRKTSFFLLVLLPLLVLFPCQAFTSGQGTKYLAFYGGQAGTAKGKATATITYDTWFGSSGSTETRDIDLESSLTFGGRWGNWFRQYPNTGLALDVSFVQADTDTVNTTALPVSLLLFQRFPVMTSETHPHGKLQPYFGIGFSLLFADIEVDFTPVIDEPVEGLASGLGLDLRLGVAWEFARKKRFFVEYRYLNSNLEIKDEPDWTTNLFMDTLKTANVDFVSNQILFGIAFDL